MAVNTGSHRYTREWVESFLKSIDHDLEDIRTDKIKLNETQIMWLFNIHNKFVDPQNPDYSRSCPLCRKKLFKRVILFWRDGHLNNSNNFDI